MPSGTQSRRFEWTEARELEYLNYLIEAVKQGQRTDTGWKPQVNADVVASFRHKGFPAVTKVQLTSKRDAVCILKYLGIYTKGLYSGNFLGKPSTIF